MPIAQDIGADIRRIGDEATVLTKQKVGEDEFGNPEWDHTEDRTVHVVRTYPNRNTTVESISGDRVSDRPVFIIPKGENEPDPPEPENHLTYNDRIYELQSPTHYDTHVEFFAELVRH